MSVQRTRMRGSCQARAGIALAVVGGPWSVDEGGPGNLSRAISSARRRLAAFLDDWRAAPSSGNANSNGTDSARVPVPR